MQGLATKNLLHALNAATEMDMLAPEVEAPRTDSFGLAAQEIERRRARLERHWQRVWRIGMWIVMLLAGAVIALNTRAPGAQDPQILARAGDLSVICKIDHAEQCLACSYVDGTGRVLHKNDHCPAVQRNGLLAMPLARLQAALDRGLEARP